MQVTEILNENLKRAYQVTVEANQFEQVLNEKLETLKVNIPGFRPGHAPLAMKKKHPAGLQATEDALQTLINRSINQLVSERELSFVARPEVSIDSFSPDQAIVFKVTGEVFPVVTIPDLSHIILEKYVADITDEQVMERIEALAENSRELEEADESTLAALGDTVELDCKGKVDGEYFEGGEVKNHRLKLGSGAFIDGFETQLVGTKAGEYKEINVTFPADYHMKDIAGKDAIFEVHIHKVLTPGPKPEPTDSFAEKFGVADLKALKEEITKNITEHFNKEANQKLRRDLFDQLESCCTFPAPELLIKSEFDQLWEQVHRSKAQELNVADSDENLKTFYNKMAERRVKIGLLVAELGKQHEITVSQQELQNYILAEASKFADGYRLLDFYRQNPAMANSFKNVIIEDKVVELILGSVKINEKKSTLQELIDEVNRLNQEMIAV
jgi:trigger factor